MMILHTSLHSLQLETPALVLLTLLLLLLLLLLLFLLLLLLLLLQAKTPETSHTKPQTINKNEIQNSPKPYHHSST
jgi:hypothetical protein